MFGHIIDRAIIHIFSAGSVYLLTFFLFDWLKRKEPVWTARVIPALIAVGFIGWREAWDVANGQPLLKAYTDYASWCIGMGLAIWGLGRYEKAKGIR